jgi:glucan biosynthesis protein C
MDHDSTSRLALSEALIPSIITRSNTYYLTYLRTFAIAIVVIEHSALAYTPVGAESWFLVDSSTSVLWTLFVHTTNIIIRPLLFFVSGFLIIKSYAKRGASKLVLSKIIRLGAPFLVAILFLNPIAYWLAEGIRHGSLDLEGFASYWIQRWIVQGEAKPVHLWFLQSLFLVTIAYTVYFEIFGMRFISYLRLDTIRSTFRSVLVLTCIMSAISGISGFGYYSKLELFANGLLVIHPVRLCDYFVFFGLGISASIGIWKPSDSYSGRDALQFWLPSAIVSSLLACLLILLVKGKIESNFGLLVMYLFLRSVASFAWLLFMTIVFERCANLKDGRLLGLSSHSYSVYIVHLPIIVALQGLLLSLNVSTLFKVVFVSTAGLVISILIGKYLLRRLPVLGPILYTAHILVLSRRPKK